VAHYNLGKALRDKGQPDEAIAEYREAIRLKPDLAMAHNNLGSALPDKGQLDEAIAECREALRLQEDFAMAHNNLGNALYAKGQRDEAIAEWREAIRLKKDYPEAHNNLGQGLQAKGRLDEAIAEYQEAIRLKKNFAGAHNSLGWLLATSSDPRFRDPAQAVQSARKAVELQTEDGNNWNTLGVAYYANGEYRAAVEALNRSMKLSHGGNAADFFFLALAHWQLGEKAQARAWYDKAEESMDQSRPPDPELRRFHQEAKKLLSVPQEKGKEPDTPTGKKPG
jgi:superkiller protein 3